jgi:hypothetical protein
MKVWMLLIAIVNLLLPVVHSWDSIGHKTVARISASLLSRKAARFVKDHLKDELGNGGQIRTRMRRIDYTMVKTASWADYVAATDPSMAWSKDLHFAHTPYRNCQPFDIDRDCGFDESSKGRCIVTAIANYTERAADDSLMKEERAEAIKFLIHLMADIHQPLHLGFAREFAGNDHNVMFETEKTNLHEVWDNLLLADQMRSTGVANYRELAEKLLLKGSVREEVLMEPDDPLTMAWNIATETIMSYTFDKAYKDNDEWIEKSDILSNEYIQDRKLVVAEQLMKAGIRLAQLLEHVANKFYESEYISSVKEISIISGAGIPLSNSFVPLLFDFDPEELVYELSDPLEPIDPLALTDGDDEEEPRTTTESTEMATTVVELTKEEKQRIRNKKDRERKARKKAMIEGVHIPSLVMIKRLNKFFITYKENVVSDEWTPELVFLVYIEFQDSKGEKTTRLFILDSQVFPGEEWSSTLLNAVFKHLGAKYHGPGHPGDGVVTTYKKFEIHKGEPGDMFGDLNKRSDTVIKFGKIPFSSVENHIFQTPSDEYINEYYGTGPDKLERFGNDYIKSNLDDFILVGVGGLSFFTRFDLIDKNRNKDRFIVSWIPLDATLGETAGNIPSDSDYLLVDCEAFDGAIGGALGMIFDAQGRFKSASNVKKLTQKGQYPLIFDVLIYLSEYRQDPSDEDAFKKLNKHVIAVNRIHRPSWPFKMDEIVLRK